MTIQEILDKYNSEYKFYKTHSEIKSRNAVLDFVAIYELLLEHEK